MTKPNPILRLDEAWIYKVSVLADAVARRTSGIARETAGLNLSQWRVLAAIADTPGRSARDVVNVTPMDKGIVSRATARLLEKGLVRKEASSTDGRVSHLYLSSKGQQAYEKIVTALKTSGADGQSHLAAQQNAVFLDILKDLITEYGSDRASG